MQSTEWPPSLPLQEFLLCPSLLLLLLADPAPAAASPNELVPVPAETNSRRLFEASQCSLRNGLRTKTISGGYSGQVNAVFRVASH